ncbi:hypothetical protein WN51_10221 [Melipona quadrifasciata]|uniref:Uncharacterized protein n=1 Tax=Melipona quadrifasciata TaxID=166423 RepID=A0A0N0BI26_9HYME|nr:hypothetical protein WN51_10221 [Melipona quadrifasciata]
MQRDNTINYITLELEAQRIYERVTAVIIFPPLIDPRISKQENSPPNDKLGLAIRLQIGVLGIGTQQTIGETSTPAEHNWTFADKPSTFDKIVVGTVWQVWLDEDEADSYCLIIAGYCKLRRIRVDILSNLGLPLDLLLDQTASGFQFSITPSGTLILTFRLVIKHGNSEDLSKFIQDFHETQRRQTFSNSSVSTGLFKVVKMADVVEGRGVWLWKGKRTTIYLRISIQNLGNLGILEIRWVFRTPEESGLTNWLVKGCLRPKERTEKEHLWKLIRKYAEHVFLCSQPARNADRDDGWFQLVQTPLQLKPQTTEPRLRGLRLGEARSVTVEEKQACTAPTAVERIVVQPSKDKTRISLAREHAKVWITDSDEIWHKIRRGSSKRQLSKLSPEKKSFELARQSLESRGLDETRGTPGRDQRTNDCGATKAGLNVNVQENTSKFSKSKTSKCNELNFVKEIHRIFNKAQKFVLFTTVTRPKIVAVIVEQPEDE